jgi:pimeloyl-ACP methyl ester carboxylesterase
MAIDSLETIPAGSTTQWIRVRGADASNPVLLLIQQGPGLPMINETRRFERLLGLEQAFTVIYWDQRGCGRSLRGSKDRAGISLERMVGDTVALLDFLRDRFGGKTTMDLAATVPRLDVPVVMAQGRHDQVAPGEAAQRYARSLQAPGKQLVWFENSAHTPHLEEPAKFRDLLLGVRASQLARTTRTLNGRS